jgi:cell division protein FtsB
MRAVDLHTLLSRLRRRPAAPLRPGSAAHARSQALTRRRIAAGLCTLAAAWVAYAVYGETAAGHAADDRIHQLQQQNAALRQEIAQRQREVDAAGTTAWLVQEARRRGYVMPGERVFVPISGGASLPADGGVGLNTPVPAPASTPSPGATPSPTATPTPVAGVTPGPPTPYVVVVPGPTPGH